MDETMAEIMNFLATLPPEDRLTAIKTAWEDSKRLDRLQVLLEKDQYTGTCILRFSSTGRGWRLHTSDDPKAQGDVRKAIDQFFLEVDQDGEFIEAELVR